MMLKSLFLIPLLKRLGIYALIHLLLAFFIVEISSLHGRVGATIQTCIFAFILVSPVFLLFSERKLIVNLSWIITTFKSRKDLLLYFFVEQIIALIGVIIPFSFYFISLALSGDKDISSFDISSFNLLPDYWWDYPSYFVFFITLCLASNLIFHSANQAAHKFKLQTASNKNKKLVLIILVLLPFVSVLFTLIVKSHFLLMTLLALYMGATLINTFLTHFKLTPPKVTKKWIYRFCTVFLIFNFLVGLRVADEITDSDSSIKRKIAAIDSLGFLSPTISKAKGIEILNAINSYSELSIFLNIDIGLEISLLIKKVYSIPVSSEKERTRLIRDLIDRFDGDTPFRQDDIRLLLSVLEANSKPEGYGNQIISPLHDILLVSRHMNGLYSEADLEALLEKRKVFSQYLALEYIVHQFPKAESERWLMTYKDNVKPDVVFRVFGGKDKTPQAYLDFLNNKSM